MIGYFFFRIVVLLFRVLPFRLLYYFSDGVAYFLHRVLKYRYVVIHKNLTNAFPHKSPTEIQTIIKASYQNLSDVLLEGIKGLTMRKEQFLERYTIKNPEIIQEITANGQSVVAVGGHYANWEWAANAAELHFSAPTVGVYKRMNNQRIETFVRNRRAKQGMKVVRMEQIFRTIVERKRKPHIYFFIADQNPSGNKVHWVQFLNQDTACLNGVDKISRRMDFPVVFVETQRTKRGYYEWELSLLEEKPNEMKEGEITMLFMKKLEAVIQDNPADWLWSHKRWKRKR